MQDHLVTTMRQEETADTMVSLILDLDDVISRLIRSEDQAFLIETAKHLRNHLAYRMRLKRFQVINLGEVWKSSPQRGCILQMDQTGQFSFLVDGQKNRTTIEEISNQAENTVHLVDQLTVALLNTVRDNRAATF